MTKKISRQIPMDDLEIYTYPVIVFPYFFDNSALLVFGFSLTRKEKKQSKTKPFFFLLLPNIFIYKWPFGRSHIDSAVF